MNKLFTAMLLLMTLSSIAQQQVIQPVNAVLNDQSYVTLMGVAPDENTPEFLRIQIHLQFVEQLLRQREVTGLTCEQQYNRLAVLDLLHAYWEQGVFPNNYDYPNERRPCFIDREGNICAVGYLIRETAGAAVSDAINEAHQYDYITDMKEEVIVQWAAEYGLTVEECAMIQPSYGPAYPPQTKDAGLSKGYGISSGLLGGANVAISVLNMSGQYRGSKVIAFAGLAAGTANIILGVTNFKKDEVFYYLNGGPTITTQYKSQNTLSYVNVVMGTTTVITSAINLLLHKKERNNVLGFYSVPGINNSLNMGFTFSKRI
jgi:hypothetical protein